MVRLGVFLFILCCATARAETSVNYIQSHAVLGSNGHIPPNPIDEFRAMRLVLIGEMHGTNEMPELAVQMIKGLSQNGPTAVGVEYPIELQPNLDRFMTSGDEKALTETPFFQDVNYGSGRTSGAMISFLQAIRSLKDIAVFCFDIPFKSQVEARDTAMASNVVAYLKAHPDRRIITYSGNLHSRLSGKCMGAEILRLSAGALSLANSRNVNIRASKGSIWACFATSDGKVDCGLHHVGPSQSNYAMAIKSDLYFLTEPEMTDGHVSTLFNRNISASFPVK